MNSIKRLVQDLRATGNLEAVVFVVAVIAVVIGVCFDASIVF